MESVTGTPAKRRKIQNDSVTKVYDSQDDSGDDILGAYDTIETVALPERHESMWPTTQHITQATQIVPMQSPKADKPPRSPSIQVTASSPTDPSPHQRSSKNIAKMIAPAGTAFCPPGRTGRPQATPPNIKDVVELSDDDDDNGPRYQADSSDDENQHLKADIKPSLFTSGQISLAQSVRFHQVTSNARYDPFKDETSLRSSTSFRSADVMASSYGGGGRTSAARPCQPHPSKPEPDFIKSVTDQPIQSIGDVQMRKKIKQMLRVCPTKTVLQCRDALLKKKNNLQDALDYLYNLEPNDTVIDLTGSEYEKLQAGYLRTISSKKPAVKQQLKEPVRKIHEKWMPAQPQPAPLPSCLPKEVPKSEREKPRRRLIHGRKHSSPTCLSPKNLRPASPASRDTDSGIGDTSVHEDEQEYEVLTFFNTCSAEDLIGIAAINEETALLLISRRSFTSLDEIRTVCQASNNTHKGKTRQPKRVGERIVEKVLDMWRGYSAVDDLILQCQELSKPLTEAMRKWGVDINRFASRDGELEILEIDTSNNGSRDSGIGTPSSRSVSIERDLDSHKIYPQPLNMTEGVSLKEYQIVGFNWLFLLFQHKLSGILADDMGLGKTCQVIAFLAHLLQQGVTGPHLIIVPSSTLENWLREFSAFCNRLRVVPYYASQHERPSIREQILDERESINVVITTYAVAKIKDDNRFLRRLKPVCCVYDEGHMLRNSQAAGYEAYMRIHADFRLLVTGTPLQNNIAELCSLLGFIMPSVFKEHTEDLAAIFSHKARTADNDESHAALLSTQRIARAKSMMSPFVLRRKKHQVLKHLPMKTKRLEYCELSHSQHDLYELEKERALDIWARRQAGKASGSESTNIMMGLRKASIHPLLFRRLYDNSSLKEMSKACLSEDEFRQSNIDFVFEDMSVMDDIELHLFCERYPESMSTFSLSKKEWMDSGKIDALAKLLGQYKTNGDRVLIFSQFVQVLNILELVMETLDTRFFRLDGSTKVEERQSMIDEFYNDPDITVFLLSTKAGGAGINLACANKVIIFDSSFNPQDDIQAENRAHRVGQTREVEVVRLITKATIEEQIYALGQTKLALDDRIAGATDEDSAKKAETQGMKVVAEMLKSKISKDVQEGNETA